MSITGNYSEKYPAVVEFEIEGYVIDAATRHHDRDNPLALAFTDRLQTRYHVLLNGGGFLIASPKDDDNPFYAAGEDAPDYHLGGEAKEFYDAFNTGGDVSQWRGAWFKATVGKERFRDEAIFAIPDNIGSETDTMRFFNDTCQVYRTDGVWYFKYDGDASFSDVTSGYMTRVYDSEARKQIAEMRAERKS